ncbi:MAG: hypothetical protein C6W57_00720 [Caldibacillus debilis]|uniref:ABC transporter ATP-binding protein n=1 Tax=Caldibacillus debilis TaxID=301148 RepID=UPI000E3A051B|nr:ABC transporter ATP-binding protein [Caldibacillus debilis]REJ19914.1 MAG: hypothetical protein C6W57_00720 [Caldibacillus debilis]
MRLNEIVIEDLSVSYGEKTALSHVSTRFQRGEIYVLLGHNGAGKTTFIKEVLKADLKRQKIKYLTDEQNPRAKSLKYRMSFSPEKPVLFEELTIMEYVSFVLKMYGSCREQSLKRVKELLAAFDLEKEKNKFIYALSNGMKKKVCHIAALALDSDFIFLDEPFAALDPVAIYELKRLILSRTEQAAIVLSTHQLDVVEGLPVDPDRLHIRLLKQGRLLFEGTKGELLHEHPSLEAAYLHFYEAR